MQTVSANDRSEVSLHRSTTIAQARRWFPGFTGWLAAILLLSMATLAHAQFGSSLAGTVEDSSGAVLPGATVTLTNLSTNQKLVAVSSGSGAYHFNELPSGHFSLAVTAKGFKESDFPDVTLDAESARDIDVKLAAGGSNETVSVSADSTPQLQTSDASIQTTIDADTIQSLPTYGSDPYELLRIAPGITGDGSRGGNGDANFLPNAAGPGGSNSGIFQTENQVQITADGQRQADNNFMIDGVSVNSLSHGGSAVVTPNIEAVGQITVISTSYDASDGRNSGAQIKVVTKSGTNQLHGSGYFQYDEPGLNSFNRWGGPQGALPERVDNKSRTYAASLGGPIWKDKVFLFASYEGYSTASNATTTAYVETDAYRQAVIANRVGGVTAAILSDPGVVPRITNVITPSCSGFPTYQPPTPPGGTAPPPAVACQVVTGGLDIGSLIPGGSSQLGMFASTTPDPALNGATAQEIGGGFDGIADLENVQLSVPSHSRGNQFNARGDVYVTPRDQVAGSFYLTKLDNFGGSGTAGSRPQADVPFKPQNTAGTGIYIHTFSPSWLNELRANGTRFADNELVDAGSTVNYGIPYVNVQGYPFPVQYGVQQASTTPAVFAENTYEGRDLLTHTWGSHTLRIGGEMRYEQDNDNLYGEERPVYAMQGLWDFSNDASVYEAITANPNNGGTAQTQRYFRSQDYALYVQHDWKATPALTLNMGLRWEYFTPLANKGFEINYPELGPSGSELSGMTLVPHNHLWNSQAKNFAPKFGFAYNPAILNNKFVVRGGFAMAYNHLDTALFNNALEDGPDIANFGLCCGGPGNTAGILYVMGTSRSPSSFPMNPALNTGINPETGFPNGVGQVEVYGAPPNLKYPMSYLFSLEVQYQLGWQSTITLGYAGSVGHHYARLVNQNFLYNNTNSPVFASYFAQTDSNQAYDAMNVQFRHNFTRGFSLFVNYAWAKSMDQVSNGDSANSNGNQTDPADNATEWGPSDYDVKHRVNVTGIYELPHVHTGNEIVKSVANGWKVSGIMTYHTGYPWTPVTYDLATTSVDNSAQVGPTRPLAYNGQAGDSCSTSAFQTLSASNFPEGGQSYFTTTPPVLPPGQNYFYRPGIGRNSFRGPCFFNTDLTASKEIALEPMGHHVNWKIQANFFNAFNKLQLVPITNGNANPGANIQSATFGLAQSGDSGRVIEFLTRIQF
jgi:Carboxypeptidase regulatory-like domain/TonB dependent receptor